MSLIPWDKRKEIIRKAIENPDKDAKYEELKIHICAFFKPGEYSPCNKCMVENYDLDECTDYFLDRIDHFQIDRYTPKFDLPIIKQREKKKLEEIENIGMTCNSCYMSEKCPVYEKHAACGIDFGDIPKGNNEKLDMIIEMQTKRIKRASTFELVDGGVPDTNLSMEIDRLSNLINMKDNFGRDKLSISLEASRDGTKPAGGLLAGLFGGLNKAAEPAALPQANTEDIVHLEIKEPVKLPTTQPEFAPDNTIDKYEPRKAPPPAPKRK
jgi:hypothetical protein